MTMNIQYTDEEIEEMVKEKKPLPDNWPPLLKQKEAHKRYKYDVIGEAGNDYRIIIRQGAINSLDFSVILALRLKKSTGLFRLRRYNGKSHYHTNKIEKNRFYDFHIHEATARYQEKDGIKEDDYAQPTDRYIDLLSAIDCFISDCGFILPDKVQISLFDQGSI